MSVQNEDDGMDVRLIHPTDRLTDLDGADGFVGVVIIAAEAALALSAAEAWSGGRLEGGSSGGIIFEPPPPPQPAEAARSVGDGVIGLLL